MIRSQQQLLPNWIAQKTVSAHCFMRKPDKFHACVILLRAVSDAGVGPTFDFVFFSSICPAIPLTPRLTQFCFYSQQESFYRGLFS